MQFGDSPMDHEDSDPILILGLDASHLETSVHDLLNTSDGVDAVLSLKGGAARAFLDILQKIIDEGTLPSVSLLRKYLRRLSARSGMLPSSLFVQSIQRLGDHPVSGGGCADIWRGTYCGEDVALKVLRVFAMDSLLSKLQREFCKEALVWRQLKHPNVAPFIGVSMDLFPPHMCMVSPWMTNGNVLQHLDKNPNQDGVKLLHGIAEGINHLHSMEPALVHGDIRGANILINENLCPMLADFGLAVVSDSQATTYGTGSLIKGSFRWMAPELFDPGQFEGMNGLRSCQADIYAFACLGVELYSGGPPFPDLAEPAVMFSVLQGKRPKLPENGTPIPDKIWDLIQKCWTHQPGQRPLMDRAVNVLESMCIVTVVSVQQLPTILRQSLTQSRFMLGQPGPLAGNTTVHDIAIVPGCKLIASTSDDGIFRVWDAEINKAWHLGLHDGYRIAFSPDGKHLASFSWGDAPICIWDVVTREVRKLFTTAGSGEVCAIAFSPDGKHIASGHWGRIYIWDVDTEAFNVLSWEQGRSFAIAFSPDGRQIASGTGRAVHIWDGKNELHRTFSGHTYWIHCIAWSPDGKSIASGSQDNTIRLWDAKTGVCQIFTGHSDWIRCLAFSPDSRQIVSGSWDATVCVWDINTCTLDSGPFPGHLQPVFGVAFSPDGQVVVSVSADGIVRAWPI